MDFGPFNGVAGSVNVDVRASENPFELNVDWADDDSFDLQFISFVGRNLFDTSFTLSDLNIQSAGQPRDIIGVAFNRPASDVDQFAAGPGLAAPSLSFTPNSLTVTFGFFSADLAADASATSFL